MHGVFYTAGKALRPSTHYSLDTTPTTSPSPSPTPTVSTPPSGTLTITTGTMRVGIPDSVTISGSKDYQQDISDFAWTSEPLPGAQLSPGGVSAASPSAIYWTPGTEGSFTFSVAVTYTDGSVERGGGTISVVPVPSPSLAVSDIESTYVAQDPRWGGGPGSNVRFHVRKTLASPTTPLKDLTDLEDPATDGYSYMAGDTDSDGQLDLGEDWAYEGFVPWMDWEPTDTRTRTLRLMANDSTGAPAFTETTQPVTLSR
jgi:hypothetical protein